MPENIEVEGKCPIHKTPLKYVVLKDNDKMDEVVCTNKYCKWFILVPKLERH
jgi:hypothetical protein